MTTREDVEAIKEIVSFLESALPGLIGSPFETSCEVGEELEDIIEIAKKWLARQNSLTFAETPVIN